MSVDQFILERIKGKLSAVKYQILSTLWDAGGEFPRGWVASSHLLELTGQKYFDRRVRELRDELGIDIETKHIHGEHHYRLLSDNIKAANPRLYLSEAQKKALFRREENTCQVCGARVEAGVRGLQADHKVPLIRGGSHDESNWQSLCNVCNVAKRRACQNCELDCYKCPWAFPGELGMTLSLQLPRELFDRVQGKVIQDRSWLIRLIEENV
ncbi:HNH endonuclease [Qipengyuania flava]|uniref:HNH endonuclease n=1 Tax=Qipengyuania flava TaxID=192812 RepID=UPI00141BB4A2|nr:HNH endonuclease [Qipengyuania flava]NIJ61139.1 hypothetical protein [Qipengyuania flava]